MYNPHMLRTWMLEVTDGRRNCMGLFDNPLDKGKAFSDLRKYVGDFEIVEVKDSKGRLKQKAIYKGNWTVLRSPVRTAQIKLWGTLLAAVALLVLYFRMLLLTHLFAGRLLVMLPLLAGLFPGLYLVMGALALPFRGKPMRRDQFMHSFIRVPRSAVAVAVFAVVGALMSLVLRAVEGDWMFMREDWLFLILCAAVVMAAFGIIALMHTVDTDEKPNQAFKAEPL